MLAATNVSSLSNHNHFAHRSSFRTTGGNTNMRLGYSLFSVAHDRQGAKYYDGECQIICTMTLSTPGIKPNILLIGHLHMVSYWVKDRQVSPTQDVHDFA